MDTFIILIFFCVGIIVGKWVRHIYAVRSSTVDWGWAGYRKFKEEFRKYNYGNRAKYGYLYKTHKFSFFNDSNGCYIHKGVIRFNNIGMCLRTPLGYLLVVIFLYRNRIKPVRHNWYEKKVGQEGSNNGKIT